MQPLNLTALTQRVLATLAAVSMYRFVLYALGVLTVLALGLSFFDLVGPDPAQIALTFVVLTLVTTASDAVAHRILRLPLRLESSLVTAGILLFVLRPSVEPVALGGIALAGVVASASKYLIAWRGRHIFNPAAFGAGIVTLTPLADASWWVGTPVLAIATAVLGLAVLWRTEKVRVVLVFLLVALGTSVVRQGVQAQNAGIAFEAFGAAQLALLQTPFLFLGAFMLSEPLTLPPRRTQQFIVAAVVGVLAGWPIQVAGLFSLGAERALLIGNLVAILFALRTAVRLTFEGSEQLTPTVRGLRFRTTGTLHFAAGQYLELDVPHRRPDARGTRRAFSIVSTPGDLPEVRIALRDGGQGRTSSYKKALAAVQPGDTLAVTGVWGDFVLPRGDAPVLLVAAGIGVTPFVSQLRDAAQRGVVRNAVLVYVASEAAELAFRDELTQAGVEVIVFTRDVPADLPAHWQWAGGVRLDADGLGGVVPDVAERHAYVSGPPRLIADLAPALRRARSLTTDAFAGY